MSMRRERRTDRSTRLTQLERIERSDRRMLKAAVTLIAKHGIHDMRLSEVGLKAGYSRGLAAMRFKTKVGLLNRVAQHAVSGWLRVLREEVDGKRGLSALYATIDAQRRWMIEDPEEMRAVYLIMFQSFDPSAEYHFNIERMLAAQRRDVARWIEEARAADEVQAVVEPEDDAAQILAAMVGIVYQKFIDGTVDVARMHGKLKADIARRFGAPLIPDRRGAAAKSGSPRNSAMTRKRGRSDEQHTPT